MLSNWNCPHIDATLVHSDYNWTNRKWLVTLTAVPLVLGSSPGEDMDVCKCIVPSRNGGTLNSRQATSPLVRLAEGEERWQAPDHPSKLGWNREVQPVSGSGNFHSFPSERTRKQQ
ncbi:uncharacterized protein TNCV_4035281 [Trichonephila clavipes]|nr:uncharacterized protein TNCV_4035281 [Trichonephila clavipes]